MFYIQKIRRPELFQGRSKKKNYFEGWYFKQVHPNLKDTVAFIPGVSIQKKDSHAFIQVVHSKKNPTNGENTIRTEYFRFPIEEFTYQDQPFSIQIGQNHFSLDEIQINLVSDNMKVSGQLQFRELEPIKKSFFCPNIMGYFAYLPLMECYHGVLSMNHGLEGALVVADELLNFSNGKGYIEKDWGTSFPKEYVWLQCNHFDNTSTSLMLSVAAIPFLGMEFKGFLVNITHEGGEYRFATYNNSKLVFKKTDENQIYVIFKRKKWTLEVHAKMDQQIMLAAPKQGQMNHGIKEGLGATVSFVLKKRNVVIIEQHGSNAGLEIVERLIELSGNDK